MFLKAGMSYEDVFMRKGLMRFLLSVRERRLVRISQKTMVSVFPFVLLATITAIFSEAFFDRGGYINILFKISDSLPYFKYIGRVVSNFSLLLGGLIAPVICYFAAKYTARSYKCTSGTAGMTAFIYSLIVNSRELFDTPINDGALTRINLAINFNMFTAICVGYIIGQIFRLTNPSDDEIVYENYVYRHRSIRPILITLTIAVIWNFIYFLGSKYNVFTTVESYIIGFFTIGTGLVQSIINTIIRSLSAWFGNSDSYYEIVSGSDTDAIANLNAALTSKGTSTIPHLFSDTNLYSAYGALAGIGATFALVVAVILKSSSDKNKKIAVRSVFPAMFNHGGPVMVGVPLALNIIYLVPFVIAPIVNVLIAAILLYFNVIPPAVYPVPTGTPSILYAFVGTAGSLRALAAAILLFVIDVLIYIPFVKLDDHLHNVILNNEIGGENDEK